MSALATTSSSMLVRWNEIPEADRNGLVLGYKVSPGGKVTRFPNRGAWRRVGARLRLLGWTPRRSQHL